MLMVKLQHMQVMSQEFIQDIYLNESLGLRPYLEQRSAQITALFLDDLEAAQQAGELRASIRRPFMLALLQQLQVLTLNPALVAAHDDYQELIREATHCFIYGLLPRPDAPSSTH